MESMPMKSEMLRTIVCCWCLNPSVNQYGSSPFNQLGQSRRWPSIFMHDKCATEFTRSLMAECELTPNQPIVAEFYSGHDHSRF